MCIYTPHPHRHKRANERRTLEICLDNNTIVQWLNGAWPVENARHLGTVRAILVGMESVLKMFWPRVEEANMFRHVYRELNHEADTLCFLAKDRCRILVPFQEWPLHIRGQSDGSHKEKGPNVCAWVLLASENKDDFSPSAWQTMAHGTYVLGIECRGTPRLIKKTLGSYTTQLQFSFSQLPCEHQVLSR